MGSAQSTNDSNYHQQLDDSDSINNVLIQPLEDQICNLSMKIGCQVEAYFEKEISGMKSNFTNLESTMLSKFKSLESKEAASITDLEQKFETLKKSVDEIIITEADKRITLSNEGEIMDMKRVKGKNIYWEKQFPLLKTRVKEITSTIDEMSIIIADLKHHSLQTKEPVSGKVRMAELLNMAVSVDTLFIILIFLIGLLIGFIIL